MRRGASSPGVPLRLILVKAKPPPRATRPGRRGLLLCAPAALMGFDPSQVCSHLRRADVSISPGPHAISLLTLFPIVFIGPAAAQRHKVRLAATGERSNLASGLILSVVRVRHSQKAKPFGRTGPFLPWAFPPSGLSERDGLFRPHAGKWTIPPASSDPGSCDEPIRSWVCGVLPSDGVLLARAGIAGPTSDRARLTGGRARRPFSVF